MKEITTQIKNMGAYYIQYYDCYAQEKDGEHGLSHLVEHCLCENIKNYDAKLKEYGISWNAGTNEEGICFYMFGLDRYIRKFINKFTKAVLTYQITPEVFERERKIVIAEYKQRFNDEFARFCINFERKHYNHSAVIGSLSDLENITYDKFMEFKNRIISNISVIYYLHPKTKKKFEFDDDVKVLIKEDGKEKKELDVKFNEKLQTKFPMEYFNSGVTEENILMLFSKMVWKNKTEKYKNIALSKVLIDYLAGGLTAYLYKEIREKLACVYSIAGYDSIYQKEGAISFFLQTSQENKDKVIKKLNKSLAKLKGKYSKRKFNISVKNINIENEMRECMNGTNPDMFVDETYLNVRKLFKEKKITFEDFCKFADQFIDNYKIYNDKDYMRD